jgi:hypothetical protein
MIAVISLLVIVTLSIVVTKVATVALAQTGLSREAARFQARSAFTGVGFTTSESERIVRHPVRRRITMFLMLLGNAGLITAVSSLILGFVQPGGATNLALRLGILFAGLVLLWAVATSPWVDRWLHTVIDRALRRRTRLEVRDYANLIHLAQDYRLVELLVGAGDWLEGRTLGELKLRDEGIVVLGIERADGTYLGVPKGDIRIVADDTLILYGREQALDDLDERRADGLGEARHEEAVEQQRDVAHTERKDARADPDETRADPDSGSDRPR